jgi:antitoxin (DNA-binding transcriptional repressor) of toxin-antitoxin stability system
MKTVGVRVLKDRLSEYLRRTAAGERVLVTDRGEVVAELGPPGAQSADPTIPAGLQALARQGQLDLAAPAHEQQLYPELPRSKRRKRSAAELLNEERGDR